MNILLNSTSGSNSNSSSSKHHALRLHPGVIPTTTTTVTSSPTLRSNAANLKKRAGAAETSPAAATAVAGASPATVLAAAGVRNVSSSPTKTAATATATAKLTTTLRGILLHNASAAATTSSSTRAAAESVIHLEDVDDDEGYYYDPKVPWNTTTTATTTTSAPASNSKIKTTVVGPVSSSLLLLSRGLQTTPCPIPLLQSNLSSPAQSAQSSSSSISPQHLPSHYYYTQNQNHQQRHSTSRDVFMFLLGAAFATIILAYYQVAVGLASCRDHTSSSITTTITTAPAVGISQQGTTIAANPVTGVVAAAAVVAEKTRFMTTTATNTKQSVPEQQQQGWKNIHVFYGKDDILWKTVRNDKFLVPLAYATAPASSTASSVTDVSKRAPAAAAATAKLTTTTSTVPKKWLSQHGQDVAVAAVLKFKKQGYFVDLAANDAVWASNTVVLEQRFDWTGLCIEPNTQYWHRLAFRNCITIGAIVGHVDSEIVPVTLGHDKGSGPFGGIVGPAFDNTRLKAVAAEQEVRYTIRLDTLLRQFQAPAVIDYLSLDVEGAELFILQDMDWNAYTFLCLSIERPTPALQTLLQQHGYVHVWDFKRGGGDTLWVHESIQAQATSQLKQYGDYIVQKTVPGYS